MQMGGAYTMVRHAGHDCCTSTLENTEGTIQKKENPEKLATTKNKAKTQSNICWTPLCANKHK